MKNFLIIDTATFNSSVSLLLEENLISCPLPLFEQTKKLIPTIETLLTSQNLTLKNIDAIAICTGPGNYTGTRVGAITAKTLSYGANIPLISFSSFDLFEENLPYATLDARCGRCYLKDPNGLILLTDHNALKTIVHPVHTLDLEPFNPLNLKNLKSTNKTLKNLLSILPSSKTISYENLSIDYPTSTGITTI